MLVVLVFHTDSLVHGRSPATAGTWISPLLAFVRCSGVAAVDLFFALISFLLCLPFIAAARQQRAPSVRRYFVRRALRILPIYYAFVVLAAAVTAHGWTDLGHALPYLVFANAWRGVATPLGWFSDVWWSLATESQFYLVLPLAAWWCRTRRGRWLGLLALSGYVAAYVGWLRGTFAPPLPAQQVAIAYSLFGHGSVFLMGAAVAWLFDRHGARLAARWHARAWLRRGGADALVLSVIVAVGCVLSWVGWIGLWWSELPPWHAYHDAMAVLAGLFIALITLAPAGLSRYLLSTRPLRRLGVLSYSMYLVHMPVLGYGMQRARAAFGLPGLVGWNWRTALLVACLWTLCVLLAETTYRLIEQPFLMRKDRLGGHEPSGSASVAPSLPST